MAYAKIVGKGVLVREKPFDGAKPLVNTPYEHRDGFRGISEFVDNGESIVEVWSYIELTDEEKAEEQEMANNHPTTDEILNIIMGVSE
jgi:hypothetical protein